jgi:hypothetical protein
MNKNHPRHGSDYDQVRRLIYEAMEIWQANSNLKLREVREDTADILIDFASGNHGDKFDFQGPGGSLGKLQSLFLSNDWHSYGFFHFTAHAFYPGSGIGGDVHMDDDESWDIETEAVGDVSFFYTLLHELGHSFGLGHSGTEQSIMYPWYSSKRTFDRSRKELFEDDIWGIGQLYGYKGGKLWGPNNPRKTTRRITTTTTPRPRIRPTNAPPPTTTSAPKPDKCNTSYDAIAIIRNELMIFKGVWMWRFRDGRLLQGYPVEFSRMWSELQHFDHIDAAFEKKDGHFVFFSGQEVMVIDSYQKAYTHNLEYLGLDRSVKKIDAIFTWGHNNQTYVFSGENYWK